MEEEEEEAEGSEESEPPLEAEKKLSKNQSSKDTDENDDDSNGGNNDAEVIRRSLIQETMTDNRLSVKEKQTKVQQIMMRMVTEETKTDAGGDDGDGMDLAGGEAEASVAKKEVSGGGDREEEDEEGSGGEAIAGKTRKFHEFSVKAGETTTEAEKKSEKSLSKNHLKKLAKAKVSNAKHIIYNDKGSALVALQADPYGFEYVSKDLQSDEELREALVARLRKMQLMHRFVLAPPRASEGVRSSKYFVLAAIQVNGGESIQYASKELQTDKEVLLAALPTYPFAIRYASEAAQRDRDVVLAAAKASGGEILEYGPFPRKFCSDKEFILEVIKARGRKVLTTTGKLPIQHASITLRSDREVVMAAITTNGGESIQYASEELQSNKEVVMEAIKSIAESPKHKAGVMALQFASKDLQDDKEVVTTAVKSRGECLQFASKALCSDKEVVLTAMESGGNLQHVSKNLCMDKEVVLAAVKRKGENLRYACDELRSDKAVVLAAMNANGGNLLHAAEVLRSDKDVVIEAVKSSSFNITHASEELQSDRDVVFVAMANNDQWQTFPIIPDTFHWDKELVLSLLSRQSALLGNNLSTEEVLLLVQSASFPCLVLVCEELRSSKDVLAAAVSAPTFDAGMAIKHLPDVFFDEKLVAKAIVDSFESKLGLLVRNESLMSHKTLVLTLLEKKADLLQRFNDDLRADREVVMKAVSCNGKVLQFAEGTLRGDYDIVMAAVRQNGMALHYASNNLRATKDIVLAAVATQPQSLKFALGGLNQERDCLIQAGLWDSHQETALAETKMHGGGSAGENENFPKVVFSTKFSLDAKSSPIATQFTLLFNHHPEVKGKLRVYSPNAWSKDTCDPSWTSIEWPCRGTFDTCRKEDPALKTGAPSSRSCWRYSFRYQLEKAKQSKGFMIQLVQLATEGFGPLKHEMGSGQKIESEMASQVGVKVFRVYQPCRVGNPFYPFHVKSLMGEVQQWREGRCSDTTVCEIYLR